MNFPRLLYRGEPETAEYLRVPDEAAYIAAKQDGWRLQRAVPDVEPEPPPTRAKRR